MLDFLLLDKKTNIKLSLLDLLFEKRDWCTIDELSNVLAFNQNTLTKYLKQLQEETSLYSTKKDEIILFKKGSGFKFCGKKNIYEKIFYRILESSDSFLLILELFKNPNATIDTLESKYFISRSTIRRLIENINKKTKPLGFYFIAKKKRFYLSGSESAYRNYLYIFFWNVYKGNIWPFEHVDQEELIRFVKMYFTKNIPLKQIPIIQWTYFLAINLTRFRMGFPISQEDLPDFSVDLVNQNFFNSFDVFEALKVNFSFTKQEIAFVFLLLQTKFTTYLIEDVLDFTLSFHKKMKLQSMKHMNYFSNFSLFNQ